MIPYLGNKQKLSKFILPNCPKNPSKWIEPFGGGMGLFFSLNLDNYPDTEFIYNDINPLNSNLFEQLKFDKFHNRIKSTKVNKDTFLLSFDRLSHRFKEERALAWLIILCCGYQKDLLSKQYKGNALFEVFKYKLSIYKNHYDRLKVYNCDYQKIIKKYDTGGGVFFYCDPIYKGYEKYYLQHNFNSNSHFELNNTLLSLKSNCALSYYEFDKLREWYKDFKIISFKHNLSDELLILNFNI